MAWRVRLVLLLTAFVGIWAPVLGGLLAPVSAASSHSPEFEQRFVDYTGRERSAHGLTGYSVEGDLADVARRHAARMAAENRLYHNPNLANEVQGWEIVGENVGRGPSVEAIHQAFMDSPTHRSEILSTDFVQVGIGVHVTDAGDIWVAEVFRKPMAAAAPAAPAAAVPSTPAAPSPRREQPVRVLERASRAAAPAAPTPVAVAEPAPVDLTPLVVADLAASQVWPVPSTVASATVAPTPASSAPADGDVTLPIRLAATLLVLVVGAQTLYVRRYVVTGPLLRARATVPVVDVALT